MLDLLIRSTTLTESILLLNFSTFLEVMMNLSFINSSAVNLRKNDYMYITEMLTIGILVPVPQKISGFDQILLPFQQEVWIAIGN